MFVGVIVEYFLVFWLLNFEVHPQGFITVLLLPAIWLASFLLIFQNFITKLDVIYQILIIAGFLFFQYYLLSTQSILNLSHFRNVSLSSAAYTTNNFYTVVTFFISILGIFLLPDVSNLLRFGLSIIAFGIIMLIFILLNQISLRHYAYALFLYISFILVLSVIYASGFINPENILLLVIVLALMFRGIIILILYSEKKIISLYDYVQLIFEVVISGILINYASNI